MGCNSGYTSGGLYLEGPYGEINSDAQRLSCLLEAVDGKPAERHALSRADFLVNAVKSSSSARACTALGKQKFTNPLMPMMVSYVP